MGHIFENKLFVEDCLETMARMDDGSVDMVLTSPPYDDLREYNGFTFDVDRVISELARIIKPSGVVVWVVGDATKNGSETGSSFRQALSFMDSGLRLHDTMIYEKNSSTFPARRNGNRYTQIFEYMFVFSKGAPKASLLCDKPNKWAGFKDYGGKLKNPVPEFSPRTNIWKYSTSMNSTGHPAPFPMQLAIDHVLSWSELGDVVYDPFMGSGTTAVAAIENGRCWIGSEISEEYAAIINKRLGL